MAGDSKPRLKRAKRDQPVFRKSSRAIASDDQHCLCFAAAGYRMGTSLQEAAYYLSPDADLVDVPTEIFLQLIKDDHLPIHTIICLNDEYKGMGSEMKHFQIDNVKKMITGSVQIVEGGHMFPQTEPAICARAIGTALENLQSQGRAEARL